MLHKIKKFGHEGYEEIKEFLNKNYHEGYTLSIYNKLDQNTVEVICDFKNMLDVISYVSNVEHDFPEWIGVNELSESYVVGIDFTRGHIKTPSVYEWNNETLIFRD